MWSSGDENHRLERGNESAHDTTLLQGLNFDNFYNIIVEVCPSGGPRGVVCVELCPQQILLEPSETLPSHANCSCHGSGVGAVADTPQGLPTCFDLLQQRTARDLAVHN
eukprot:PhM_4_TR334/c1_g1_i1/m.61101